MNIIHTIDKKANGKNMLILLCTSAVLATCIMTMFFGRIELKPEAAMDSLNFYSADVFFHNLDIQGAQGRSGYLQLHAIDYLFITQFYLLFALLIAHLLRKVKAPENIAFLCLIPMVAAVMDLLENIFIDISILIYPQKILAMGTASGYFTLLKMSLLYISFALIFVLLLIRLVKKFGMRGCSVKH